VHSRAQKGQHTTKRAFSHSPTLPSPQNTNPDAASQAHDSTRDKGRRRHDESVTPPSIESERERAGAAAGHVGGFEGTQPLTLTLRTNEGVSSCLPSARSNAATENTTLTLADTMESTADNRPVGIDGVDAGADGVPSCLCGVAGDFRLDGLWINQLRDDEDPC
jgi:hypothetical protein